MRYPVPDGAWQGRGGEGRGGEQHGVLVAAEQKVLKQVGVSSERVTAEGGTTRVGYAVSKAHLPAEGAPGQSEM